MNEVYNNHQISITIRATRSGGRVYDVTVSDMKFNPIWCHTTSEMENAVRIARKWIDGTDRSVGMVC